ncbi:O-antigen ligase family protein [Lentzea sp. JNUCC 0626]|uniref:O-antigen ligase family protein n=1 Tax=Lentzea sp. JNUCC 0626 TaxID=3367513 RepID=UPI00374909B8
MGDVVGARRDSLSVPALLVVAGFAAAVVAQGGYYLPGRILSAVLVVAAVVVARPRLGALAALGGAFAVWALGRGVLAGDVLSGVPSAVAVAVFVGAAVVAAQGDREQRELLATVVVGVGALVGVTGWVAVVWRVPGWTTVAEGLARAASTLTYPNAAAAVMAAAAVLSLVLKTSLLMNVMRFLLCVGIGATMSRAGVIAVLVGLVVLAVLVGVKETVERAVPPLLGAAAAVAALLPTMRVDEEPQALLAFAGLVAGAVVAVGLPRLKKLLLPVAVVVSAGVAAIAVAFADRLATRVSFSSPDRSQATEAAFELVGQQPLIGTGPGEAIFFFVRGDEGARVMRYVHNEYLQVLVELGVVGLALALAVIGAVLVRMWGGKKSTPLHAGAFAAVVVVLVHSGFDFLWHLPVVLIVAGLCAGLGFPSTTDGMEEGTATP